MMSNRFDFYIDVIGACNLKCPSCPAGNMRSVGNPKGAMKASLLKDILDKASSESEIGGVALFNWTEPFLHHDIANLVRISKSYGAPCRLSTNLNVFKNVERTVAEEPASIRISVSGFGQENYQITHAGGDVEVVKKNMEKLAEVRQRLGVDTKVEVVYHRYLGNLDDEVRFRRFAAELGFSFQANWAFLMPLDKLVAYLSPDDIDLDITDDDREILARLALPVDKAVAAVKPYRDRECRFRDTQMAINVQGDVMLCCGVYDASAFGLGKFMELPVDEIQKRKYSHSMCAKCQRHGLYIYGDYGVPELDKIALQEVLSYYQVNADIDLPTVRHRSRLTKALIKRIPVPVLVRIRGILDRLG